jgi:hypothetical protein
MGSTKDCAEDAAFDKNDEILEVVGVVVGSSSTWARGALGLGGMGIDCFKGVPIFEALLLGALEIDDVDGGGLEVVEDLEIAGEREATGVFVVDAGDSKTDCGGIGVSTGQGADGPQTDDNCASSWGVVRLPVPSPRR